MIPQCKKINDSGWITTTYEDSFANYNGSSASAPKYRKIGNIVSITGIATPASELEAGVTATLFTLPKGYRPTINQNSRLMQGSSKNYWRLTINTDGTVTFSRYGSTSYLACPTGAWLPFDATFFAN